MTHQRSRVNFALETRSSSYGITTLEYSLCVCMCMCLCFSVSKIRDSHPHLTLHNLHSNAVSTAEMAMSLLLSTAKLLVPADR